MATKVLNLMGKYTPLNSLNLRDKPYTQLKPGQASMERDYFAQATKESPNGKAVLSNYGRFESVYGQNLSKNTANGDYVVPLKNNNTMCKPTVKIIKYSPL